MPFLMLGVLVFLMGSGTGLNSIDPPPATSTPQPTYQQQQQQPTDQQQPVTQQRPIPYGNGYADSGHQGTLIGDMVYQMTHETLVRPETLAIAEDMLARCALLAEPRPPVCH